MNSHTNGLSPMANHAPSQAAAASSTAASSSATSPQQRHTHCPSPFYSQQRLVPSHADSGEDEPEAENDETLDSSQDSFRGGSSGSSSTSETGEEEEDGISEKSEMEDENEEMEDPAPAARSVGNVGAAAAAAAVSAPTPAAFPLAPLSSHPHPGELALAEVLGFERVPVGFASLQQTVRSTYLYLAPFIHLLHHFIIALAIQDGGKKRDALRSSFPLQPPYHAWCCASQARTFLTLYACAKCPEQKPMQLQHALTHIIRKHGSEDQRKALSDAGPEIQAAAAKRKIERERRKARKAQNKLNRSKGKSRGESSGMKQKKKEDRSNKSRSKNCHSQPARAPSSSAPASSAAAAAAASSIVSSATAGPSSAAIPSAKNDRTSNRGKGGQDKTTGRDKRKASSRSRSSSRSESGGAKRRMSSTGQVQLAQLAASPSTAPPTRTMSAAAAASSGRPSIGSAAGADSEGSPVARRSGRRRSRPSTFATSDFSTQSCVGLPFLDKLQQQMLEKCKLILEGLRGGQHWAQGAFNVPVNGQDASQPDFVPNYKQFLESSGIQPIDLTVVRNRLFETPCGYKDKGEDEDEDEDENDLLALFRNDVQRVFRTAMAFYPPTHPTHQAADKALKWFEQKVQKERHWRNEQLDKHRRRQSAHEGEEREEQKRSDVDAKEREGRFVDDLGDVAGQAAAAAEPEVGSDDDVVPLSVDQWRASRMIPPPGGLAAKSDRTTQPQLTVAARIGGFDAPTLTAASSTSAPPASRSAAEPAANVKVELDFAVHMSDVSDKQNQPEWPSSRPPLLPAIQSPPLRLDTLRQEAPSSNSAVLPLRSQFNSLDSSRTSSQPRFAATNATASHGSASSAPLTCHLAPARAAANSASSTAAPSHPIPILPPIEASTPLLHLGGLAGHQAVPVPLFGAPGPAIGSASASSAAAAPAERHSSASTIAAAPPDPLRPLLSADALLNHVRSNLKANEVLWTNLLAARDAEIASLLSRNAHLQLELDRAFARGDRLQEELAQQQAAQVRERQALADATQHIFEHHSSRTGPSMMTGLQPLWSSADASSASSPLMLAASPHHSFAPSPYLPAQSSLPLRFCASAPMPPMVLEAAASNSRMDLPNSPRTQQQQK